MIKCLMEKFLPFVIGIMVHKIESLTQKEKRAQQTFWKTLKVAPRKTKQPIVVACIGLVGSGKSSVAKELARLISATVIDGDQIRVHLRKEGEKFEGARKIAENVMVEVIKNGGNAIMDSDHIDAKKQASLREKVRKAGAKLIFVRSYADYDVMSGRIISAIYHNQPDDFFGGASTKWSGDEKSRGAVVKLREMWRRTPNHYRWDSKGGGKWIPKKLPFLFAEIDTTDAEEWKKEIRKVAAKILSF